MKCPNCGQEGQGQFCTNCGARMEPPPEAAVPASDPGATSAIRSEDLRAMSEPEEGTGAEPVTSVPAGGEAPPFEPPTGGRGWQQSGAASAGVLTMQTMTLGQIVSHTFDIIQTRLRPFLQIAAAYTVAMFVAFVVFFFVAVASIASASSGFGVSILGVIIGFVVLIAVAVVASAVAAVAYINIARGTETVEGDSMIDATIAAVRRAWQDSPRLLMALLVLVGVWIGVFIAFAIVGAILGKVAGGLAVLVGLAGFCVAIWLAVSFAFVPQAAVIDDAASSAALSESMNLVSGRWWRTFGYLIVAYLIGVGIYIAGAIIIGILNIVLSHIPVLGTVINALLQAGLTAIFYAFFITYGTLMFFDLKARKAAGETVASAPGF